MNVQTKLTVNLFLLIIIFIGSIQSYFDPFDGYYDDGYLDEDVLPELFSDQLTESEVPDKHYPDVPQIVLDYDWPSPEAYEHLGRISAIAAVNPTGSDVLVLHRGDRVWDNRTFDYGNRYLQQDLGPITDGVVARLVNGQFVAGYLKNKFYMPHGITVDHEGNVWITDVALHQVFKFGPNMEEEPLLVLGEAFVPGSDSKHFCKPTHVVVARNGDFFVSDGYCNNRVMKFHANGTLIKQWGRRTKNPMLVGDYELNLPHQLALAEDLDLLCVADRENQRVACYRAGLKTESKHQSGEFQFEFREGLTGYGPVYGVAIAPKKNLLFALVGEEQLRLPVQVRMFDLNKRRVVGTVIDDKQDFGYAHTIATCDGTQTQPGCLFVCNLDPPADPFRLRSEHRRRMWLYRFPLENDFRAM